MFISSSHVLTIPSSLAPHPRRHLQTCFLFADSTRFREPGYVVLKASHRTVTSSACFSRLQATERLVLLPSPERWTKQQTVRLSRRTLTDPPYLVGFRDRQGRTIAGDKTDEWLQPAGHEMYRVLKKDVLLISFYGWNRVDRLSLRGNRPGSVLLVIWFSLKPTHRRPHMWATATNAPTSLQKAVRPCRKTR